MAERAVLDGGEGEGRTDAGALGTGESRCGEGAAWRGRDVVAVGGRDEALVRWWRSLRRKRRLGRR